MPPILPGPSIGDPGLQIPVHILHVMAGGREDEVRLVSGLVDPDELIKQFPDYAVLEELARRAADMVGPGEGSAYGTRVHHELKELINNDKRLPAGMEPEISYDPAGSRTRYGAKGSLRIDVGPHVDTNTVRVYELKTGGAALKEPRVDRTLRYFAKKATVIVMELNPWRTPRK